MKSAVNFSSEFTRETAKLSTVDDDIINEIDNEIFHDFSYINPHMQHIGKK